MADATWKQVERAVARRLGGRRLPLSGALAGGRGGGGGGGPDVDAGWCACEVKTRKTLPQWLIQALAQARRAARDGQLPIVVLHELGQRHRDDLVVLTLGDFVDWFGSPACSPYEKNEINEISRRLNNFQAGASGGSLPPPPPPPPGAAG